MLCYYYITKSHPIQPFLGSSPFLLTKVGKRGIMSTADTRSVVVERSRTMQKAIRFLCPIFIFLVLFSSCGGTDSDSVVTTKKSNESNFVDSVETPPLSTGSETNDDTSNDSLVVLNVTSPVEKGQFATLNAKGKPNTEYSITVHYPSGAATASGLDPKISDSSGNVSWTWKVGGNTTSGEHKITVTGGGETVETSFVTESSSSD